MLPAERTVLTVLAVIFALTATLTAQTNPELAMTLLEQANLQDEIAGLKTALEILADPSL